MQWSTLMAGKPILTNIEEHEQFAWHKHFSLLRDTVSDSKSKFSHTDPVDVQFSLALTLRQNKLECFSPQCF